MEKYSYRKFRFIMSIGIFYATLVMCFIVLTMRTKEKLLECISQLSEIEQSSLKEISKTAIFDESTSQKESRETEETKFNKKQKANQQKKKISSTVRVDVERLEYLMNLVGELVIDQTS
ncbi:hypothetical protein [Ureibacillus thermosphaericus]|uniref:hypothetical protein n=1 Tax=Ureibacillus thermosphaericus TaxID=51173 RepID=UPI0030C9C527